MTIFRKAVSSIGSPKLSTIANTTSINYKYFRQTHFKLVTSGLRSVKFYIERKGCTGPIPPSYHLPSSYTFTS